MLVKRTIRIGGEEWFLITSFFIVALLVVVYMLNPALAETFKSAFGKFTEFLLDQGYLGAFIIALVSNSSVFIVIPYLPAIFFLGSIGLQPLLVGLAAGLGATIGEIISYIIGWGGGKLFAKKHTERFQKLNAFLERKPRMAPLFIFLFALLPIPDDILIIPLGVIRYPLLKAVIPLTLGKMAYTIIAATGGSSTLALIKRLFGSGEFAPSGLLSIILTILVIYLTLKVRWEKIIEKVSR